MPDEAQDAGKPVLSAMTRQEMMQHFQGLVRALAWKIHQRLPPSVEMEDLIAYGQLGLLEAADHFDPLKGFQFTTYAYYRIRGAILDGLSQLSWFDPADYYGARYRGEENSEADDDDTFESHQNREASIRPRRRKRMHSIPDGTDVEDRQSVLPETQLAMEELCGRIRGLVENMPGEEGKLLRAQYFDGMPMNAAAALLGISKSWASRLHDRALTRLGESLGTGPPRKK